MIDRLAAARGVLFGSIFGLVFWTFLGAVLWAYC